MLGILPEFKNGHCVFSIDTVFEDSIAVTIHYKDERHNRSLTINKGESEFYRPMSCDGGYQYTFFYEDENNRYCNKKFSILGDSISTLQGYDPTGYNIYYSGEICEKTGVREMNDTWWGKVIDYFGGELLVNNSWSGSRVTKHPAQVESFPASCSDERTSSLHKGNATPDVIVVCMGINDWAYGADINVNTSKRFQKDVYYCSESSLFDQETFFESAYNIMLNKIKSNYPHAEIWCCTLNKIFMPSTPLFNFPHSHSATHINEYNQVIRIASEKNSCKLIDLYSFHLPYDTLDGTHPNSNGMDALATLIIRSISDEKEREFLMCRNDNHESVNSEKLFDKTNNTCKSRSVQTPNDLWIGKIIGNRYKLVKWIGGGFEKTYQAVDECNNKTVAVKIIYKKNECCNDSYIEQFKNVRMHRLIKMMSFNHSVIPRVYDIFESDEYIAAVIEFIEGETLSQIMSKRGVHFTQERTIKIGLQLCDALLYLHRQNPPQIHSGVIPSNILIQQDGSIKLIEFENMTDLSGVLQDCCIFTPRGYLAPELFVSTENIDERTDIYSLGATLYYLATGLDLGKTPYEIQPIRKCNPAISKVLERIIVKCLQINPGERYQNCEELIQDLKSCDNPLRKNILKKLFGKKKGI